MEKKIYDVIQVGYGPVSAGMALMLGRQQRSVAVIEKWQSRYPLPRAVCIDHELYRVLFANGLGDVLPEVTQGGPLYQWFNAEWKELLTIDWSAPSISGGPETNFVHQPTLEAALDKKVQAQSTVDLHLGWEVTNVTQEPDFALVAMKNPETGEERRLSARFVVGCDGANSVVRKALKTTQEDRGFEADWLVIDALLKDGVTIESLGIPPAAQYCNPERPTTIVPAGIEGDKVFRRWEFMRLPGETNEELEAEDRVWELLKPWAGPDDIELVRHKIYNFRSLLADDWRDKRLLIAGDAAHVMPPFMGQGMCSGLRDAWNLSWKLGLILDDLATLNLLDTYRAERLPHVSQITDISIYLGKMICTPDRNVAAKRDKSFFDGTAPPPPPFPSLIDGLINRQPDGSPSRGAGDLSPHSVVRADGQDLRLDALTGDGFVILSRGFDARPVLANDDLAKMNHLGVTFVEISSGHGSGVEDVDGRINQYLEDADWCSMIIRPDYYIYGGAQDEAELRTLVGEFSHDLQANGVLLEVVTDQPNECSTSRPAAAHQLTSSDINQLDGPL